jgi:peptidase inhibitor family I36
MTQNVHHPRKVLPAALAALAILASSLLVGATTASASSSQCSENTVCAWSQSGYEGTFSWWPASETGCHNHSGNPTIRSGWNRTGYMVRYGGGGSFPPGKRENLPAITGEICWPI